MHIEVVITLLLTIPLMFLLDTLARIRKERVKREKNFIYCKADIMESETLRDYLISEDYKNHRIRLIVLLSIYIVIVIGIFIWNVLLYYANCMIEPTLLYYANSMIEPTVYPSQLVLCLTLFILLAYSISLVHPIKDTDELQKYRSVRDELILSLESELPSSAITTSKMFDSGFLKAFIQRANKRIHMLDYDFFNDKKFLKEKVKEFVGLLRPSLNYFLTEDNQIVQEYDTYFIYKVLKTKEKLNLPELREDIKYHDLSVLEIVVWLMFILVCYTIFDKVYTIGGDISSHVSIIITISIMCMMFLYYILIAKDRL